MKFTSCACFAVAYVRYSSSKQDDGYSIEAQKKAILKYCNQNNITVLHWYEDKAFSGTSDRRPAFQQMFQELSTVRRNINYVLVHKFDRFARNTEDAMKYRRMLESMNIGLISISEPVDSSPIGKFQASMYYSMSEFYSANLSVEVKKGLDIAASNAQHTGGKPPYGFSVNSEKKYEIVEEEAENIKLIFSMYANGHSHQEILDALLERNAKTRFDNEFGKNSIIDILKNEKYKGVYVYNITSRSKVGGTETYIHHSEDEIIKLPDKVPRIIDDELFNRVKARMDKNRHGVKVKKKKRTYLLTTKLICGICGHSLTGNFHTRRCNGNTYEFRAYRCNNQLKARKCPCKEVNAEYLERYVVDLLKEKVFSLSHIDDLYAQLENYIKEESATDIMALEKLRKEQETLQKKIHHLLDFIESGNEDELIMYRLKERKKELSEIERKIYEYDVKDSYIIDKNEFKKQIKKANQVLTSGDVYQIRPYIEKYIDKIVIDETNICISIKLSDFVVKDGASDENRTHVVSLEG